MTGRMRWLILALCCGCVSYAPPPACDAGATCPAWECACGAGTAGARACVRGRCAVAEDVCHDACADAGSCWQGRATGGWKNGNSVGQTECLAKAKCGDDDFADLGAPCASVNDCQSGLCLGSSASFICVKACTDTAQCPAGWVCGSTSSGARTCFLGAPEHQGVPISTNNSCAQVGFDDIGMSCQAGSQCQSRVCFGNATAGFFCSRRCNDDSLCSAGFHCVTSAADSARFCEKAE
ncbi:MAG: hypothetical protein IPJ65_35035 [Archangiaceae bacterium]|nr:hypothetical protein [Archangiaceae bacterium]